jgi:putative transposase
MATMCRVLRVQRSGFYAWLRQPLSDRGREDLRLLGLIRSFYAESGRLYGSPRIHKDLKEFGEHCGEKRVARLMHQDGIRAQRGYKRPRHKSGPPAVVAPDRVKRQFSIAQPNQVWVTDITYIRTYEGWLYLAVVIDLFSRCVVGWSMKPTLAREIVLDALLMAIWRRRPRREVIIHSDQGSQYSSDDWIRFLAAHNLKASMSRRGNCFDNAVVESFFSSLKKERIRRKIYATRAEARAEIFDYIEVFYNRTRRHSHLGQVSPAAYEGGSIGS